MEDEKLIQNIEHSFVEPQGDDDESTDKRAALWAGRLSDAEGVQKGLHAKWDEWYKMMYAATETDKMALWKSRAFLPILAGKAWDLVSRVVQYKPSWAVEPYSLPTNIPQNELTNYLDQLQQNYDKVKMKMDYDYSDPVRRIPVQDEFFSVVVDSIVAGTGIARVTYEEVSVEQREHPLDALNNVDITLENITTTHRGFNNFESVNIFNFYIDPAATDLQTADWIIIQDTASKAELLAHPEYDQQAIEDLKFGVIKDNTANYQKAKVRHLNTQDISSADTQEQKVHILDCWDGEANTHTIYAVSQDRKEFVELFREDNPYWHQKYPYVAFRIRRKPHLFWGESFFENSESLQAAVNDLFNHYMDNLNLADGMIAIEEGSVVEPYMIEPGGEFRYRGERPTQFKFPEPNPAQLTTVMNQIQGIIEGVTISQYASGVPNSATDKTQGTATGVTRLMEAATEKIGMMRQNIRRAWAEVGNMWLVNSQQFMVEPVVYQKNTHKGSILDIITPSDIRGNFVLRVNENSFEPVSADQMRTNYISYIANLQSWAMASREQAQANGNNDGIISINYAHAAERLSELSSENPATILMHVEEPQALEEGGEEELQEPQGSQEDVSSIVSDALGLNQVGDIEPPQGMNAGTETPDMYMPGEEATADPEFLGLDRGLKNDTTRSIKGIVL